MYADDFERAQRILDWIKTGEGDSLVSRFHPAIRATLPAPAIEKVWSQLEEQAGAFVEQGEWQSERCDTLLLEQCRLTFDQGQVRFVLFTDENQYVVGFHFKPIVKNLIPKTPEDSLEQPHYVEKDTFVINGRIKLPATLCLPVDGQAKYPVVVMVHGIGPTDKDGTLGPNKPYREVAHSFAAQGIATFRYDKRTFVYGSCPSKIGEVATYDTEVVDDAIVALDLVAGFPEVDAQRVFVLGHSLGGMLVPRIAMLSHHPLAGMISVAGPARSLEDWLRVQFRYLAEVEGTPIAQADSLSDMIYSKMPAPYRAFASAYNPVGTARGLHIPMLFLQGGHDFQVTHTDFEMWQKGLEGCENVRFVWLENGDHLLRDIPQMAVPEMYMRPGKVSKEAVDAVVKFVLGRE